MLWYMTLPSHCLSLPKLPYWFFLELCYNGSISPIAPEQRPVLSSCAQFKGLACRLFMFPITSLIIKLREVKKSKHGESDRLDHFPTTATVFLWLVIDDHRFKLVVNEMPVCWKQEVRVYHAIYYSTPPNQRTPFKGHTENQSQMGMRGKGQPYDVILLMCNGFFVLNGTDKRGGTWTQAGKVTFIYHLVTVNRLQSAAQFNKPQTCRPTLGLMMKQV